ncbi:nucleotidyltransferase domain-containing protein [Marinobacterium aestuariivivens]|uniref:Nucleotidyltransferase domain-containing protein n=1 Tax=Marinobacterium aestuariivivens TaxID=1698799 RepID=A0ABW1ZV31_9GAMM
MMNTSGIDGSSGGKSIDELIASVRKCCQSGIGRLRLAILFGSCSTGSARSHSDIDVAVQSDSPSRQARGRI